VAACQTPLFPLGSVVFPGGPLPLRIFEPRYVDMVGRCLKTGTGFGAVAIRSGAETGEAETFGVGTLAEIVDWYAEEGGLLGIMARGRDRFRIERVERLADGLYVGDVTILPALAPVELPERFAYAATFLGRLLEEDDGLYRGIQSDFGNATWVGCRLAEILPLPVPLAQELLEIDDPLLRLDRLEPAVRRLDAAARRRG
jgi:uncharacterized protein